MLTLEQQRFAAYIDHTLLKPDATQAQIAKLCDEALEYSFASVCVNPCHVPFVAGRLSGSPVKTCAVVGFPLGANSTDTKAFEAELAAKQGAKEVDMVLNVGALKAGETFVLERDINAVVEAAVRRGALCKVIIETCLLTTEEKILACKLVTKAEADFIKTSTGFSTGGATVEDVKLLRANVGKNVAVKASGGIRDLAFAQQLLEAGASRLGTSSGTALVAALAGAQTSAPQQSGGY